jgi:orotidine-5'-phosphate decarboxylase
MTHHAAHPFAARLAAAITARRTPSCIGLDPRRESLPPALGAAGIHDPKALADVFARFCRDVIDVVAPLVPIVKPQLACFEAIGPHGMTALADVIAHAHSKGLLVLADGKRGDIGSTAEAYAEGWLAGPWAADALTVNPYLGHDSIEPFVKTAETRGAGIFVLVKTSNPGSKDFQDLVCDGKTNYEHVAASVEALAARTAAGGRFGAVGAVVGATWPKQLDDLRAGLRRGFGAVASTGSIAPFVGLFGTVVGIISAFEGIAKTGSGGLGSVSAGIAEALVVTAYGLAVAIPAVLAFNYLSALADEMERALTSASGELLDLLEHGDKRG